MLTRLDEQARILHIVELCALFKIFQKIFSGSMANADEDVDEGVLVDTDSGEEDGPAVLPAELPRRDRLERIALFDFLRLVAGNREHQPGFRTIEELVNHLKANDTITRWSM